MVMWQLLPSINQYRSLPTKLKQSLKQRILLTVAAFAAIDAYIPTSKLALPNPDLFVKLADFSSSS